jgi:tRNA/tmRNA/rRNA uracil-C5-methylase (TrmA/RlmC/RlmD family)
LTHIDVTVERVAHGGICVGRSDGRVVFVRHAIPGERVRAVITEEHTNYLRADAVEIIEASADRVTPPCAYAGPGRCGGCDWQHVSLDAQRALKAAVVQEQLQRLAGLDLDVEVVPLPDGAAAATPGLGWRTRVGFAVRNDGVAGLHRHRSHDIEPIDDCLIAHPLIHAAEITAKPWPGASRVDVTVAVATGERMIAVTPRRGRRPRRDRSVVTEYAAGRSWRVTGSGFWQVHPAAADVLVAAVVEALDPQPGDDVIDLYAGVGLFAGAIASRVAPDGTVVAIESEADAVADATYNLRDLDNVHVRRGRAADVLERIDQADLVVLDPPRAGAGPHVMRRLAAIAPRRVAYVSCDPATLARDLATAMASGLDVVGVRAFDLFPMTAHVECVATLAPAGER